jgi:hypothetical protein
MISSGDSTFNIVLVSSLKLKDFFDCSVSTTETIELDLFSLFYFLSSDMRFTPSINFVYCCCLCRHVISILSNSVSADEK